MQNFQWLAVRARSREAQQGATRFNKVEEENQAYLNTQNNGTSAGAAVRAAGAVALVPPHCGIMMQG